MQQFSDNDINSRNYAFVRITVL